MNALKIKAFGGLLPVLVVLFGATVVVFSATDVGHSTWNWIATTNLLWKFAPVLYAMILGGVLYTLAGWIFGLVAFSVARRPAWHKGFALATVGLGFAVVLCVVLVVLIISYLSIPCMSADACAQYHQAHP